MPPERQRRRLDPAGQQGSEEVAVKAPHTIEVDGVPIDPQPLHDRLLAGAAQGEEQRLIRIGHHVADVRSRSGLRRTIEAGHTEAFGMRGEVTESARPSATRRKTIFIRSTYWATDSRAMGLSG